MKATEFAYFFEFSLEKVPLSEVPEDIREDFDGSVSEVFVARDCQGVFQARYFDKLTLLVEQFDSMLSDYIKENIEEDGFEPDHDRDYYQQALEYCDSSAEYRKTTLRDVVACIVDPSQLEDDVTVRKFRVTAVSTEHPYLVVEARSAEEALEIADNTDGGLYTPDSCGTWDVSSVTDEETGETLIDCTDRGPKWTMTPERTRQLLDNIISHEMVARTNREAIEYLMFLGFTADELVHEFHFSEVDVAETDKYEISEVA